MRLRTMCSAMGILFTVAVGQAGAQTRYDVGLLLGATRTTDEGTVLAFNRATTFQATFAWRLWKGSNVGVSLEVPFLASPTFIVATPGGTLPKEYAALYLTPGVRVTLHPNGLVSVFGSAGGGYARYSESKERANGSPNPNQRDTNTGALAVGAGVDVGARRWLAFRGEIREMYTGARHFSIVTPPGDVHNVVVSGGFVLRF
ncbi:MAG: outer membrane beta-barrel protein [Acidobacteriota bacterium]